MRARGYYLIDVALDYEGSDKFYIASAVREREALEAVVKNHYASLPRPAPDISPHVAVADVQSIDLGMSGSMQVVEVAPNSVHELIPHMVRDIVLRYGVGRRERDQIDLLHEVHWNVWHGWFEDNYPDDRLCAASQHSE